MKGEGARNWRALLAFELGPSFRGPLPWAALAGLICYDWYLRFLMAGHFTTLTARGTARLDPLVFVSALGYSGIPFLATLLTLSFCLDRTGAHYLRNNDLLTLSRSVGRRSFYLAKMAAVIIPVFAYCVLATAVFWGELYRSAGVSRPQVFLLILPLTLGLTCLVSLYFLMRHFLGNFMIFFLWLLLLPVIYVSNLWRYYAGFLREEAASPSLLGLLPQFGGIHAFSLGLIHDLYRREETWRALAGVGVWTVGALAVGLWVFDRKRL